MLKANSSTPRRSRSWSTDRPSQASWPSWLPESTTTRSSASEANWATAWVNWGWASRIMSTSGGPASISNPSPAITKAAGPWHFPRVAAISSATAVEVGVATAGRWRSLTRTVRLRTGNSSSTLASMREEGGLSSVVTAGSGLRLVRLPIGRRIGHRPGPAFRRGRLGQLLASGRSIGKRMTSRMASTSASSMIRRSMPMPIPRSAAGRTRAPGRRPGRPGGPRGRPGRRPRPRRRTAPAAPRGC